MLTIESKHPDGFSHYNQAFPLNYSKYKLFNTNNTDKESFLEQSCLKILENDTNNVNLLKFQEAVFYVVNQNAEVLFTILQRILQKYVENIGKEIETKISNSTFFDDFFKLWNGYMSQTRKLRNMLWFVDKKTKIGMTSDHTTDKKVSRVNFMRMSLFYNNIIDKKYNDKYLLEILAEHILQFDVASMNKIIHVMRLYDYLYKLKTTAEFKYNSVPHDTFCKQLNESTQFVERLVLHIHNYINDINGRHLPNLDESKAMQAKMFTVFRLLRVTSFFKVDPDLFLTLYSKYLGERLLNNRKLNLTFEKRVVERLNRLVKLAKSNINKMFKQIEDIKMSRVDAEIYKKKRIELKSDIYKELRTENLDTKIIDVNVIRSYAWPSLPDVQTDYKIPLFFKRYVDSYTLSYKKNHDNRKLTWNFDQGCAVIKMAVETILPTLESKTEKKDYFLFVTTPQLFILTEFNNRKSHTMKELSDKLGMTPEQTQTVLNQLWKVKLLLKRSPDEKNTMEEYIYNPHFKHTETKLSIADVA